MILYRSCGSPVVLLARSRAGPVKVHIRGHQDRVGEGIGVRYGDACHLVLVVAVWRETPQGVAAGDGPDQFSDPGYVRLDPGAAFSALLSANKLSRPLVYRYLASYPVY